MNWECEGFHLCRNILAADTADVGDDPAGLQIAFYDVD